MNTNNRTLFLSLILFIVLFTSCTDSFDDMNKNPNAVTDIDPKFLITNSLMRGISDYSTHYYTQGYACFLVQYIANSNVGHLTDAYYFMDPWNSTFWSRNYADEYRGFIANIDEAVKLAAKKGLVNQEGPARIWKVFLFSKMTDCWGPIPYFEYAKEGVLQPAYTPQNDIYADFFAELKKSITLMDETKAGSRLEKNDIIYNDDLKLWRKLANSLRMRFAMRLASIDPARAKQEFEAAIKDQAGIISRNDESAGLITDPYGPAREHDDNPWKVMGNFFPNWFKVSETFIDMLQDLKDPRMYPYVAPTRDYVTNMQTEYKKFKPETMPQEDAALVNEVLNIFGDSKAVFAKGADYLDKIELFLRTKTGKPATDPMFSRYKGLRNGQPADRVSILQNSLTAYSQLGEFIKADNYPTYIFIYPEICFLKAEAALKGWSVGGTAKQFYEEGVRAALELYKIDKTKTDAYLTTVAFKETGTTEQQMEQIITQKYIAFFTDGFEAWADWRRTGYPRLLTALSKGDTDGKVPRRWNYTYDEFRFNQTSVEDAISKYLNGPNTMLTPLWWDADYSKNPSKWNTFDTYNYLDMKAGK